MAGGLVFVCLLTVLPQLVFPPVLGIMNAHVCAKIIFWGVSEVMYAEYL